MQEVSLLALAESFQQGETVFLPGSSAECVELTDLLIRNPALAAGTRFIATFVPGINTRCIATRESQRTLEVLFMQNDFREAQSDGRLKLRPLSYYAAGQWILSDEAGIDTVVAQVSEPDSQGECSLGPCVEFMPALLEKAPRVLGVINSSVPRFQGAPSVPLERFELIARSRAALATYSPGPSNALTDRLMAHTAELVPSGSTVEVGLGKAPLLLLRKLAERREIVIHSGLLTEAVADLAGTPALQRSQPLTATIVMAEDQAAYECMAKVPGLQLREVGFTHNPATLARLEHFRAVNGALEVDLLGQVNAEMLDGRYVSGPGGLPDFARGAQLASRGLSIIVLPSTDARGLRSRIVPRIANGGVVTLPHHEVGAIVTEHGSAILRDTALDERMHRLIRIAHPDHREALEKAGRELLRSL